MDEKNPDIYVRIIDNNFNGGENKIRYRWYLLKGDSTTPEDEILTPELTPLPHHFEGSACAALGSIIYMSGGQPGSGYDREDPCSKEVYCIDTHDSNGVWKKVSDMNVGRSSHYSYFDNNGKMYVVGGNTCSYDQDGQYDHQPTLKTMAETYDPDHDRWHSLPRTANDFCTDEIVEHSILRKKVFFHSDSLANNYYYYDTESELWGVVVSSYTGLKATYLGGKSYVLMDGIVYIVDDGPHRNALYAYDITEPSHKPKLVSGLSSPTKYLPLHTYNDWSSDVPSKCIIKIGDGKLAVVWTHERYHNEHGHFLHLHCSRFQILKQKNIHNGEVDFTAKLLSFSSHYVNGNEIDSCLTMLSSETRRCREPNPYERVWTYQEDFKLVEALKILQAQQKYNSKKAFKQETFSDLEIIMNITLPDSGLKGKPHIKARIEILRDRTHMVRDMISGSKFNGFRYDDKTKRVVADEVVWDAYLKENKKGAIFKDKCFYTYRELCFLFGLDEKEEEIA